MRTVHFTLLLTFLSFISFAQQKTVGKDKVLNAGPLLGYCEMKEAAIWVQTKEEAKVYAVYSAVANQEEKLMTNVKTTTRQDGFTAILLADKVQPGVEYMYDIFVNDVKVMIPYDTKFTTQEDWRFKKDPSPFTAVFGSCTYVNEPVADRPGKPYGGDFHIFKSISNLKPDIMLWGGDNIYLRPVDWNSRSGFIHRYTHARSLPEMQELLATCPQLAIWDDHDFGPNDANGSYVLKPVAHEIFRLFWPNPTMVNFLGEKSICSHMEFNGIDFFTLDNRTFRTEILNDTSRRQIFGKEQLEWLINNLKYSQSPFKMVMVGGQMLNDAMVYENFSNYPEERQYLLRRIKEENIKGVIFLSGDRHHSEISKITYENGLEIFDITSSPLTSGAGSTDRSNEKNNLRVSGSLIQQRNFAHLHFSGPFRDRLLDITFHDSNGSPLFSYQIKERDIFKNQADE